MIPNVRVRADGWSVFRVPYDHRWIAGVKEMVPGSAREWSPSVKEWSIAPGFASSVAMWTREVYGYVVDDDAPGAGAHRTPEPEPIRRSDPDLAELHLLPSAPRVVIDAAYRALARSLHPDAGGDTASMQTLNAAYGRLRERVAS